MEEINTNVSEVTVYLNRARVSRAGKARLNAGKQSVSVQGLPSRLDRESVRVKASGTAPVKILSVDIRKSFFRDIPDGIVRELTEKIDHLKELKREKTDHVSLLEKKMKHFDGIWKSSRIFASGFSRGMISVDGHRDTLKFLDREGESVLMDIRKIEKETAEIDREIKKLSEELDLAGNSKPRERYTAEISMDAEKECEAELDISYRITGASWKPEYDIRINGDGIRIEYFAEVTQRTGEDWNGSTLILSTLTPTMITEVPDLEPWFLSPLRKKPSGLDETRDSRAFAISGMKMPDTGISYTQVIREEFPDAVNAEFETASMIVSDTAVSYRIKNPSTIGGNGSGHRVKIADLDLEKNFRYVTAPRIEEKVFRIADTVNRELFLLPGRGQIFNGDEYAGPVSIPAVAPGEEFELFAGSDDMMKINRELRSREVDRKILSDRKKINYSFEITAENLAEEIRTVTVKDQIPVPAQEDIKVRFEESSPKTMKTDELNRFEWKLDIPSGGKQSIVYHFSIEYPRDMDIPGLP